MPTECEEYMGILRGILSLPEHIVMDLNNVMHWPSEFDDLVLIIS